MMKIKDHNGLIKEVLDIKLERYAQPEHMQNAIYCVFFKDTTLSYFEQGVDIIEIHDGLSDLVKRHVVDDLCHALQTVLNTFGRTDGVCVTTQTKQHVLHEIRELLERLEHE